MTQQVNKMETLAIPASVYDINTDWINRAIHLGGHDVNVISIERIDVIHATCTKARFALKYDRDIGLPKRMILKGAFEDHSERLKDMYQSEARFYGQIASVTPLNTPQSYWAGIDPDGWRAAILMEDLNLRNVHFCRAQESFSYEHVKKRLEQLATLHAQTWQSKQFERGGNWNWIEPRFGAFSQSYHNYYLTPKRWQEYMKKPRGVAVSSRLQDRDWMHSALERLGALERQDPICLIHGDTHPGNLYLDADGTPAFLDTALSRSTWWMEITYHITASLDIADRRNWDIALLGHYLNRLEKEGGPRIPLDEGILRFQQAIAYGLFIFLINETTFQTEATNTTYTARFGAAALDHRTIEALQK